jgi:hypothetical protein
MLQRLLIYDLWTEKLSTRTHGQGEDLQAEDMRSIDGFAHVTQALDTGFVGNKLFNKRSYSPIINIYAFALPWGSGVNRRTRAGNGG